MSEDDAAKDHEPTQRKLDQAREKGEIVRSPDLVTAGSYVGLLIASVGFAGTGLQEAGHVAARLLAEAGPLSDGMMRGAAGRLGELVFAMVAPLWSLALFPATGAVIALTLTRGWLFTPEKLAFRLSRVSPTATAKHKFGPSGLFEFGKGLIKLCIVSAILFQFLILRLDEVLGTQALEPAAVTGRMLWLVLAFLALIVGIAAMIGGADYLWQWFDHHRRNRMSRQELVDEARDSDGDPHQRAARRQKAQDIATNRMLADVGSADVVVVNPTHFAVALKWQRTDRHAPVCVAKGADEIALRIRERATAAGVPIHSDPPTARALHASVEIGQEIQPAQYRAVAAAIRFSEAMRKRAGRRG